MQLERPLIYCNMVVTMVVDTSFHFYNFEFGTSTVLDHCAVVDVTEFIFLVFSAQE